MADKTFFRETAGAVAAPINVITAEGRAADWIQSVAGGSIVFTDGSGASVTIASAGAGDSFPGPIRAITSTAGKARYGTGPMPIPGPTAAASASATAAAASATTAAGYGLVPSATVITADPAPAVIGTLYVCNPSAAAFSVALPAISAGNHGKRIGFTVSTTSANAVTPVPNGTDTLPGGFASVAGTYGFATLEADNTPTPKVWRRVG